MLQKIRENKKHLIVPGIVILLPILAGLILWNRLPDPMPIHFNVHNEPDGWSSKWFAVVCLPVLMCVFHGVCVLGTALDKKNTNQNNPVYKIVYWIFPAASLFGGCLTYSFALGYTWSVSRFVLPVMGLLFIWIGNYLPKIKPNHTLGIRLPWTLENEDNWHATHRLGGKVWVIGGTLFLLTLFLPAQGLMPVFLLLLLLMVALPTVYSYLYHKKHGKA